MVKPERQVFYKPRILYHSPLAPKAKPYSYPEDRPMMEINPIYNKIKDLQVRSAALRGYL
jgi:hypothetical protein